MNFPQFLVVMGKVYLSKTPIIVRALEVDTDPFRSLEEGDVLDPKFPYQSAIEALMYLANSTRPNIAFVVNLLARHSVASTKHHWNGVKNILRNLQGTTGLGLF
jgi:hypothetical protein